jgi:hypothetical protein
MHAEGEIDEAREKDVHVIGAIEVTQNLARGIEIRKAHTHVSAGYEERSHSGNPHDEVQLAKWHG